MGDSPGHGHELNPPSQSHLLTDSYPSGDKGGLTAETVMAMFHRAQLDFMFARVKPQATMAMQRAFEKFYNHTGEEQRTITILDMFEGTGTVAQQVPAAYHLVFVLDESGSMNGTPWQLLSTAFSAFIQQRRNDQGMEDRVSVIQFDSGARQTMTNLDIRHVGQLGNMQGGGTTYCGGLQLANAAIRATPLTLKPMLIFMSDGEPNDGQAASSLLSSMYQEHRARGLQVQLIGFGNGSFPVLDQMAAVSATRTQTAATGSSLIDTFQAIANQCSAVDRLVAAFAKKISEQISTKIMIDSL
jgi:uncharacterized protein YegL